MKIDIAPLVELARNYRRDSAELITLVSAALTDAHHKAGGDREACVEIAADGTCEIVQPDFTREPADQLGRLAATTVRQAVQTWVKDLQRRSLVGHWADLEGEAVTARVVGPGRNGETRLLIQGTAAVLPAGEAVAEEELHAGDDIWVLLLAANADDSGRIRLTVSRRQPHLVPALLKHVCPALADGRLTAAAVARDPGRMTKVAISGPDNANPVSAVTGHDGSRLQQVIDWLDGEPVHVVRHHEDPAEFAAAALAPATATSAVLLEEPKHTVQVVVPADQVEAANGPDGLHLKLATKLLKRRIVVAVAG